jgi:hypothetical protein
MTKTIEELACDYIQSIVGTDPNTDISLFENEYNAFISGANAVKNNVGLADVSSRFYQIDFGNHLRCKLKITDGKIEVEGAINGWGDSVPLEQVVILKLMDKDKRSTTMETNMTTEKALDILERHNLWRRGADYVDATDPRMLGMALDKAIEVLRLSNVVGRSELLCHCGKQAVHQALSLGVVVKSLPNDDEIEKAANEEASRIFDGTGSGSEWYARHHGFTDGVEWLKNHLAK